MNKPNKHFLTRIFVTLTSISLVIAALLFCGCAHHEDPQIEKAISTSQQKPSQILVEENGWYTSKDDVALYIHEYGHLPSNFISKTKAKKAGWESSLGNLDEVCPGMSIGGGRYYNDDEALPESPGRTWKECDINYSGGFRNAERIVFSNDGLIYYTPDHYKTFYQLF